MLGGRTERTFVSLLDGKVKCQQPLNATVGFIPKGKTILPLKYLFSLSIFLLLITPSLKSIHFSPSLCYPPPVQGFCLTSLSLSFQGINNTSPKGSGIDKTLVWFRSSNFSKKHLENCGTQSPRKGLVLCRSNKRCLLPTRILCLLPTRTSHTATGVIFDVPLVF